MKSRIINSIKESINVKQHILSDENLLKNIEIIVSKSVEAFKEDKKMLLCGNGGSASDAQHIAAELSGRFYKDRKPLFAEALHVNSSFVTAVANDYGYDNIYSRMVEAAGRNGDIFIGISTSGNSTNVVNAIIKAKEVGMVTIGFTGAETGKMDELCDIMIKIPSSDTPRIQESHILVGHIICQFIEEELF
ncbi:MAG: D-sedoheptulose-7-phosphate isomerase [Flavobacteriales bacterium]